MGDVVGGIGQILLKRIPRVLLGTQRQYPISLVRAAGVAVEGAARPYVAQPVGVDPLQAECPRLELIRNVLPARPTHESADSRVDRL